MTSDVQGFKLIDTRAMPVETSPEHPDAGRQLLSWGEEPGCFVKIVYAPPGFTQKIRDLLAHGPHRHYHRSVNERHYILGGDYPVWHWHSPEAEPVLTRVRRHHYLENPPGTLHGIRLDETPRALARILQWNDGIGTELYEPGAEEETLTLPLGDTGAGVDFQRPILVDAAAAPWAPHRSVAGWETMSLGEAGATTPPAFLVRMPPQGEAPPNVIAPRAGETAWLFVISGDLSVFVEGPGDGEDLALHADHFLSWAGERHLKLDGIVSRGGATVLCVGHDLAE